MVSPAETAHEQIHEAHHAAGEEDHWPRQMAVVVSILAACLAIAGIGAKSSQTAYLTNHIGASDTWNFYQAKNLRANLWSSQVALLDSLPNSSDEKIRERIANGEKQAARLRDDPASGEGMKQLMEKAKHQEHQRDHDFHAYHAYEYTAGALEIAIVLASVSVITRIRHVGVGAAVIGSLASAYGAAVFLHLI